MLLRRSARCLYGARCCSTSAGSVDWGFPVTYHYGAGRAKALGSLLAARGASRPLVVTDAGLVGTIGQRSMEWLQEAGVEPQLFSDVQPNPTDVNVMTGAAAYRSHQCDSVVAIGGGSGLDAGKAIAMVVGTDLTLDDLEWTKDPQLVGQAAIPPVFTIPTTSVRNSSAR